MSLLTKLFGGASGSSASPSGARKLMRQVNGDNMKAAAEAIAALGRLPFSQEVCDFLIGLTGDATFGESGQSKAAIAALGQIGHPSATERLVKILASGSLSFRYAAEALGHPHNAVAIPALLELASTSDNYICVEGAIKALQAIGTPEARTALERFYQAPARELSVLYTGFETRERISSSALGQQPDQEELRFAVQKLVSENPFYFADDAAAEKALALYLAELHPLGLYQLRNFLRDGPGGVARAAERILSTSFGGMRLTNGAIADHVHLAVNRAKGRHATFLKQLAATDTTRMELHLLSLLPSPSEHDSAAALLMLLPRLRAEEHFIAEIGANRFTEGPRLSLFRIVCKHAREKAAPALMEWLSQNPASTLAPELTALLRGVGPVVLESALRLLADDRWPARMRAIEVLGGCGAEVAHAALRAQLAVESNYEMQKAIKTALSEGRSEVSFSINAQK